MSATFYEYGKTGKALRDSLAKQRKYLQAQLDQSIKNQDLVREFQATQGQIVTPTKYELPLEEQLKDKNLQLRKALSNVQSIIKDPQEAKKVIDGMDESTILKFNQYAPGIISSANQKYANLTASGLLRHIAQFLAQEDDATNLLNTFVPRTTIDTEENTITTDGVKKKYRPYRERLSDDVIQALNPDNLDMSRLRPYQKLIVLHDRWALIDQVRDRLEGDIKKASQKRGQVELNKLTRLLEWKETVNEFESTIEMMVESEELGSQREMSNFKLEAHSFDPDVEQYEPPKQEYVSLAGGEEEEEVEGMGLYKPRVSNATHSLGITRVFKGMKPVYGRGLVLATPSDDMYVPFGRYVIHYPHLKQNVLNIRFKSKAQLTDPVFKRKVAITDGLKGVLLDLIDDQTISKSKTEALSDIEKQIFNQLLKITKLSSQIDIVPTQSGNGIEKAPVDDETRFKVIVGEMKAGNDNPELVRQLVGIIGKFIATGRIETSQGQEILRDLNVSV